MELTGVFEDLKAKNESLASRNEELDALKAASKIIITETDPQKTLDYIYRIFQKYSKCNRLLIGLPDQSGRRILVKYELGEVTYGKSGRFASDDGLMVQCFQEKKPILHCNTTLGDSNIPGDKIVFPMWVSGDLIGVLQLSTNKVNNFLGLDLPVLENLVIFSAIAFRNAEQIQNITNQQQHIHALYEKATAANQRMTRYIAELDYTREELRRKNEELLNYNTELENAYMQTVFALSNLIEAKDVYTRGHCQRVMEIACELATALNFSENEIKDLRYAAILHDIGKIGISAEILNKNGRLTSDEFVEVKKHSLIAFNILKGVDFLHSCLSGLIQHHERYDGKGYPLGLKGDQISIYGKILALADSFDAMTSDRPYRKAMDLQTALEEIKKCKGSQFDPFLTEVFVGLMNGKQL